jgi:hypothetical protein
VNCSKILCSLLPLCARVRLDITELLHIWFAHCSTYAMKIHFAQQTHAVYSVRRPLRPRFITQKTTCWTSRTSRLRLCFGTKALLPSKADPFTTAQILTPNDISDTETEMRYEKDEAVFMTVFILPVRRADDANRSAVTSIMTIS